jgi:predicted MFS family arabinose efflux permease
LVATTETPPAATASFGSKPYRTYALASLLAMYTLCHIDRVLVPVLQEPIKHEFGLSDLQLGLMVGPAFALFYATLGLPVARLAERANRVFA